jgi:hypothetical protein
MTPAVLEKSTTPVLGTPVTLFDGPLSSLPFGKTSDSFPLGDANLLVLDIELCRDGELLVSRGYQPISSGFDLTYRAAHPKPGTPHRAAPAGDARESEPPTARIDTQPKLGSRLGRKPTISFGPIEPTGTHAGKVELRITNFEIDKYEDDGKTVSGVRVGWQTTNPLFEGCRAENGWFSKKYINRPVAMLPFYVSTPEFSDDRYVQPGVVGWVVLVIEEIGNGESTQWKYSYPTTSTPSTTRAQVDMTDGDGIGCGAPWNWMR